MGCYLDIAGMYVPHACVYHYYNVVIDVYMVFLEIT